MSGSARLDPTLYLIRHGETDWNVEGRLQGQKDTPINARGELQAARNGVTLATHLAALGRLPDEFDWVASPMLRARRTMEIVRAEIGLAPGAYRLDPVLKELTFGTWEGATLQELRTIDPVGRAARRKDKWRFVPPDGESYEMLSARIAPWLFGLKTDTVCVAHGGITRVVRGLLEGVPFDEVPVLPIPQDRIYLWRNGAAEWV